MATAGPTQITRSPVACGKPPDLDAVLTAAVPYSTRFAARADSTLPPMNAEPLQNPGLNGAHLAPRRGDLYAEAHDCPPHAWGCPVVMKLDPRSVAWTCAHCGAIVTVPVGAPRPSGSETATG